MLSMATLAGVFKSGSMRPTATSRRLQMEYLLLLLTLLHPCRACPVATVINAQDCMMQWLLSLRIDQNMADTYHSSFSEEYIDQQNLPLLSMDQLETSLNVTPLGHRVLIHNAAISGTHDVCRNGGSCNFDCSAETYICSCPTGFSGDYCQIASGCGNNPCKNGGTCTEETDGAICCACPTCYHGDLCQYLTTDYSSLAETVVQLSTELQALKEICHTYTLAVADTIRQSTGLRFFKPWLEIDLFDAFFIRHFVIDVRCFLGVITHNNRQATSGIVIYEIINSERIDYRQTLDGVTATSFKAFSLEGYHYMVVGHHYDNTMINPPRVDSELYVWNGTAFELSRAPAANNNFRTRGVTDVDYTILADNSSFIAFAAHNNRTSYNVPTYIYYHHNSNFIHFGSNLPTTGASRVNFFTFDSVTYLFVAEEYSAMGAPDTRSSIFRFETNHFALFQEIETDGASDFLPFSIGDNFFVVAVNYGHQPTLNVQSKIYLMCDGVFVFYTAIDTKGARKADFFRIGIESFLVFSNSQDDTNGSVSTNSVIYRVEGAKFVCFQEIPTENAMYVHIFKLHSGCPVLAVANKADKPRLYKWTSLSFSNNEIDC